MNERAALARPPDATMAATDIVRCELCPRACRIAPGRRGDCRVRVNLDGRLAALTYGHPCAVHVDPIEKKPFYHVLPGAPVLSLATAGCNLHCRNCQNWEISQRDPEEVDAAALPPAEVAALARRESCPAVAYTYTEPLVFYEYTFDCCEHVRAAGLRNLAVTAGYLNEAPLRDLYRRLDAVKVDFKAMSESFYRDVCGATLRPVLRAMELARELVPWLEICHLVIPTLNDRDGDFAAVARWVAAHLGRDTPLHLSRFFPQYRMRHLPPTPATTLERARAIARAEGLRHIYVGNVAVEGGEDTVCPACGAALIRRSLYRVAENRLRSGACPDCGERIPGLWE